MTIEETRSKIISSIWQAFAQSSADLQSVPPDKQAQLVETIANNTMFVLNDLLDEFSSPQQDEKVAAEGDEQVLWKGRPFLSLVESYLITSERIKITRGLFGRDVENFELIRIQDIDFSQGLNERILGIGDITIAGQDPSNPKLILRNVSRPEEVYELIRRAWLAARKRYGLQFREFM